MKHYVLCGTAYASRQTSTAIQRARKSPAVAKHHRDDARRRRSLSRCSWCCFIIRYYYNKILKTRLLTGAHGPWPTTGGLFVPACTSSYILSVHNNNNNNNNNRIRNAYNIMISNDYTRTLSAKQSTNVGERTMARYV